LDSGLDSDFNGNQTNGRIARGENGRQQGGDNGKQMEELQEEMLKIMYLLLSRALRSKPCEDLDHRVLALNLTSFAVLCTKNIRA
jgi:hypothetical protein